MKSRISYIFIFIFLPIFLLFPGEKSPSNIKSFQDILKKKYAPYIGVFSSIALSATISTKFRSYLKKNTFYLLQEYPTGVFLAGGIIGLNIYNNWKTLKKNNSTKKNEPK